MQSLYKRFINTLKQTDKFLLIALAIFLMLIIPFINAIPYLDGNIEFIYIHHFYVGGFHEYFLRDPSVHPPFKVLLFSSLFHIFGISTFVYDIGGLFFGCFGIFSMYYLASRLFNKNTARISALLLATSPLFISTGIFSLGDFVITVFLIAGIAYYATSSYKRYAFFASCAVLQKETALLLPLVILFVEVCYLNKKSLRKLTYLFIPFVSFGLWMLFLRSNHQEAWQAFLFTPTASKGTFYTVIYNLVTFHFLNPYGYQQWLHLFVLNFNWIYWIIIFISLIFYKRELLSWRKIKEFIVVNNQKTKTILILILFFISYFFAVLTIQTFTIPRYTLPLLPFVYLLVSYAIGKINKRSSFVYYGILVLLINVGFINLFFSADFISRMIWGETTVLGETFYDLPNHLAGNDGITYNMQYVSLVKKRTEQLYQPAINFNGIAIDCAKLFPDPKNDFKTLHILRINSAIARFCGNTL